LMGSKPNTSFRPLAPKKTLRVSQAQRVFADGFFTWSLLLD
jgi:hypothetical protein